MEMALLYLLQLEKEWKEEKNLEFKRWKMQIKEPPLTLHQELLRGKYYSVEIRGLLPMKK